MTGGGNGIENQFNNGNQNSGNFMHQPNDTSNSAMSNGVDNVEGLMSN